MNKLAYCGLLCEECEIYKATISKDNNYKQEVAKKFSSPNYIITIEDINCYGCSDNSDAIFKFCAECEIRLCGISKSLKNCGECSDFSCEKLTKPFEDSPENKERLVRVKS